MQRLRKHEKERVRQFCVFTGAQETVAIACLRNFEWDLEPAVDNFFARGGASSHAPPTDANKVKKLFDKYKGAPQDHAPAAPSPPPPARARTHTHTHAHPLPSSADANDPETIQVEGIEKLCADLGVDPTDLIVLIISWQMQAKTMCVYTREEFTRGLNVMGVDSIDKWKSSFERLRGLLNDKKSFRDFYSYCFLFAKDPGFGVRTLPFEVASQMWRLTLTGRFKLLDEWLDFLERRNVRAVTKDMWDMTYTFSTTVRKADLSDYDEDGAWPVLLDDFVDELKGA